MEWFLRNRIFHPPRPLVEYPAGDLDEVCAAIWQGAGVATAVMTHPAPKCVVLYMHGNAENIETAAPYAGLVREACHATVYSVEYPGYFRRSDAEGAVAQPCEEGVYSAARQAAEIITARVGLPLVVFGYSLGTAPAVHTAATLGGRRFMLVLVAPLLGAIGTQFATTESSTAWSFLYSGFDVFRTEGLARKVDAHTLICHGTDDEAVPIAHGHRLGRTLKDCVLRELPGA